MGFWISQEDLDGKGRIEYDQEFGTLEKAVAVVVEALTTLGASNSVAFAIEDPGGEELKAQHVVLALGHSARDTFEMLHARGVYIEAKPFSIGFRIEHPQSLIDRARFGANAGHPLLASAVHNAATSAFFQGFHAANYVAAGIAAAGAVMALVLLPAQPTTSRDDTPEVPALGTPATAAAHS